MTDFDRPDDDPTTDTSITEVPAAPIATHPRSGQAGTAAAGPRRSRARWARGDRHRRPHRRRHRLRDAVPDRFLAGLQGRRLRARQQRRVRRAAPRPAGRPAPGGRQVPEQVPGLRGPGRARHQARRGARPAPVRGAPTASRPTPATSSRGSTASSGSPWGRCPRTPGPSSTGDRRGAAPRAAPAVDQGRGARPSVVHEVAYGDRRHRHAGDVRRAPS